MKDKWITEQEAMLRMKIKSKLTIRKLRDENKIVYARPMKKLILYDAESIDRYLGK